MTKRLMALTLASVFAVASAGAIAETPAPRAVSKAVQLSEAELDQITAGSATSELRMANPSNHRVDHDNRNHLTLINLVPLDVDRATGRIDVTTPNGRTMTHCIGGGTGC